MSPFPMIACAPRSPSGRGYAKSAIGFFSFSPMIVAPPPAAHGRDSPGGTCIR
jgi:hypothetical protein